MAKPICLIRITHDVLKERDRMDAQNGLQKKMEDYHVFVLPAIGAQADPISFQVFHEKDFTEIQYAELRKIVEEAVSPKEVKESNY